jgi:chromosome segregation ATPase
MPEKPSFDELEKKFKLSLLQIEKRLLDLEVAIGEIKEKLDGFDLSEISDIKERLEDVEDLATLENVGILEFKKMIEEIKERLKDIKNINTSIISLQKKIAELETSQKIVMETSDTKKVVNRIKELQNEIIGLRSLVGKLEKTLYEKIGEIEGKTRGVDFDYLASKIESIKNDLDYLNKKKVEMDLKLAEYESKFDLLEENLKKSLSDTLLNEIKGLKKDLIMQNGRVDAVESVTRNISTEINRIETELKKFKSLESLTNLSKDVEEKIETIRFLENEIRRISSKVETIYDNISNEIGKIKNFEVKLTLSDEAIKKLQDELDKTKLFVLERAKKTDVGELIGKINELRREIDELRKEVKTMPKKEITHIPSHVDREELSEILNRMVFLESRISAIEKALEESSKVKPIVLE